MTFTEAGVSDYIGWLRGHLAGGGTITHAYDYPFERAQFLVAHADFTLGGECGTYARPIIVPRGVKFLGGKLGHNHLYLLDGSQTVGTVFVPVYADPEFASVPGYGKAFEREQKRRAEWEANQAEQEAAMRAGRASSDLSRHLHGAPPRRADGKPGTGALHAHELTADDAAMLRVLAGSVWAPGASLTLPSGRTVTGAEISRWVQ